MIAMVGVDCARSAMGQQTVCRNVTAGVGPALKLVLSTAIKENTYAWHVLDTVVFFNE